MTPAERILAKALVGSDLDTAGWSRIQAGLRDRAFFSATVQNVRVLHAARAACAGIAAGTLSPSEARRDLRTLLGASGYDPGEKRGTIEDLLTKRRLDLVIDTNVRQAKGYAAHLRATTSGALAAFPAYRLVRVRERRLPRDWAARWRAAADAVGWAGVARDAFTRVALKTSPIWAKLSRFNNPFPPFDFNSGMGLEDVPASTCREIGLVTDETPPQTPPDVRFNGSLQAEIPADAETAACLEQIFGEQITVAAGVCRWNDRLVETLAARGGAAAMGGGVTLPARALEDVASDVWPLVPALVRGAPLDGACTLESLAGGVLTATLAGGTVTKITRKEEAQK